MENLYYQITFFEDRSDEICHPPYRGNIKAMKWLKFEGNDKHLTVNEEVEDENLAIQILIQNLNYKQEKFHYIKKLLGKCNLDIQAKKCHTRETLENTILGKYEKVMVTKYTSTLKIK